MQLQRERARHHYKLHQLDQRVDERLYRTGTSLYVSYMDNVIPIRVNPTPPLNVPTGQDIETRSQPNRTGDERPPPQIAQGEGELPMYEEVMQDNSSYHIISHGAAAGAPNFLEDSSSTSDSDSTEGTEYVASG